MARGTPALRVAQPSEDGFRNFIGTRLRGWLRGREASQEIPLALAGHFAVAKKGRQDLFMTEVLAPGLELFGGFTDILAKSNKGISEAVWIEIRQIGADECLAKHFANGRSAASMGPV